MTPRRPSIVVALAGVASLGLAACTTPSGNFKNQTEEYLEEAAEVSEAFDGVDVSEAVCETPDGTDVGTTYVCTAQVPGQGNGTVSFRIQITGENEFSVVSWASDGDDGS